MDKHRLLEGLPYLLMESFTSSSITILLTLFYISRPELVGLWLPVIAASFLFLSTIADYKTTELGLKAGIRELNPTVPEHPIYSQLFDKKHLPVQCALMAFGTMFAPFGIGIATSRTAVALSNLISLKRQLHYNTIHNTPGPAK